MNRPSRFLLTFALLCATTLPAFAQDDGGAITEPAFYNGQEVEMIIPAIGEDPENVQIVADCFRVGPMVDDGTRIGGNVYVVAVPGATQEVTCSTDGRDAGDLTHNHVFAVGPGDADYNGHFQINLVVPGPNYPGAESADSYNSEETVLAGVEAGELMIDNDNVARVAWSVQLP